jgi:hypothetical protein
VTSSPASERAARSVSGERDQAIDIVRGLALMTITINHITGFTDRMRMAGMQFPTLTLWGFSSAAEIFFLLSGYLVGAVYFSAAKDPPLGAFAGKVWRRTGKLYVYNLALFVALIPLCLISRDLARLGFYNWFFAHAPWSYGQFLLLYVQPYCLEILVTYMALLAAAPAFAAMLRFQPLVAIAISIGIYYYAHEHAWFNIRGGTPVGDWRWNFNPMSWQVLFYGAMAAGRWRMLDRLRGCTQGNGWLLLAAWAVFIGLTILFLSQGWYGFQVLW